MDTSEQDLRRHELRNLKEQLNFFDKTMLAHIMWTFTIAVCFVASQTTAVSHIMTLSGLKKQIFKAMYVFVDVIFLLLLAYLAYDYKNTSETKLRRLEYYFREVGDTGCPHFAEGYGRTVNHVVWMIGAVGVLLVLLALLAIAPLCEGLSFGGIVAQVVWSVAQGVMPFILIAVVFLWCWCLFS